MTYIASVDDLHDALISRPSFIQGISNKEVVPTVAIHVCGYQCRPKVRPKLMAWQELYI